MNLIARFLDLFKAKHTEASQRNQQWLTGHEAFKKGEQFYLNGQLREALDCLDTAILYDFADNRVLWGKVYGTRGSCLQSLGFDLDAIDDFDKAIASEPEDSNLHYMRSVSRGAVGDLLGAVDDLKEAMRLGAVENSYTRPLNELAREKGYSSINKVYELQLMHAELDIKMQQDMEHMHREHPSGKFGTDIISRRRAQAKRRPQARAETTA